MPLAPHTGLMADFCFAICLEHFVVAFFGRRTGHALSLHFDSDFEDSGWSGCMGKTGKTGNLRKTRMILKGSGELGGLGENGGLGKDGVIDVFMLILIWTHVGKNNGCRA